MTIQIDWEELAYSISDRDGFGNSSKLTWDVPHEIYKSTTSIDKLNPGTPLAVLPPYQVQLIDEDVKFDQAYYYRIGELRPGGKYMADQQIKIKVNRLFLVHNAPHLVIDAFDSKGKQMDNGSFYPLPEFKSESIPQSWFWDGIGEYTEWLEYWANDTYILTRYRGESEQRMGTIHYDFNDRDYPAGTINYDRPFTSPYYYLTNGRKEQAPTWWYDYWQNVDPDNYPTSWHTYWSTNLDSPAVTDWYNTNY